jgi:hypothetical protein
MHDKYPPVEQQVDGDGKDIPGPRRPRPAHAWRRLARRAVVALALGLLFALAPLPARTPDWLMNAQLPLAAFLAIVLIGKALYDTLFWERYR